jgi:hypothetical protein
MAADPGQLIVEAGATEHAYRVHHHDLPELRAEGESTESAAANLVQDLDREIDSLADSMHREPLRRAIADVRAFIEAGC